MWRLWNKLFGWDYVAWNNCVANGIAKIFLDGDGNVCFYRYKSTNVIDKVHDYHMTNVIFLTCPRSKYIKSE